MNASDLVEAARLLVLRCDSIGKLPLYEPWLSNLERAVRDYDAGTAPRTYVRCVNCDGELFSYHVGGDERWAHVHGEAHCESPRPISRDSGETGPGAPGPA